MTSLESEVDRLSQSLNAQRSVVTVAETGARKVAEEHAREASSQVRPPVPVRFQKLTPYLSGARDRAAKAVAQRLC